jgi:predicted nucleotidyltransferase
MDDKNQEKKTETTSMETTLDDKQYQDPSLKGAQVPNAPTPEQEKEMQKVRGELDKLKKWICKTYKDVAAIGIIPPQAAEMFDDENELTEVERKSKPMHLLVVFPDDKEKEYNKIKVELMKKIKEDKHNIWLNLFLEMDLWEICMDSKFNVIEAIGMAYPLYDKGTLGALRVAQIHKSLVLKKFEKYVYSYVIWGSLPRGEVQKTSDVDVAVIIDDTDVKRMPRLELKEKLRNIIHSYVMQAGELAGVKNKLSPNIYLLTEFWESVKDANPIFYTLIRDGVAIYDRGGFLPWKLLLRMGKIKPSPESIDMFMASGDKTQDIVKRKLLDIVIGDIYWGIITPTQAMLMLYGLPPINVYETSKELRRIFVEKEKLLEKKYADIFDEIVIKYYKGYEHGKIKDISGKEVDKMLKNSEDYMKKLKALRGELEKRMSQKTFEEIYTNVFKILKSLFGNKSESVLVRDYEKEIVNKGKGNPRYLKTLHELVDVKKRYKTKKAPSKYAFEGLRKDSVYLIQEMTEFGQRKDLGLLQKTKVVVTFEKEGKDTHADLFLCKPAFLVDGSNVKKIEGDKILESNSDELNGVLAKYHGGRVVLGGDLMKVLKKEIGEFSVSL